MTKFIKLSEVKNDELKSVTGGLIAYNQIVNDYGVENYDHEPYVCYGVESPR